MMYAFTESDHGPRSGVPGRRRYAGDDGAARGGASHSNKPTGLVTGPFPDKRQGQLRTPKTKRSRCVADNSWTKQQAVLPR